MVRRDFLGIAGALAAGATMSGTANTTPRAAASKPTGAAAFRTARRMAKTSFGEIAYFERGESGIRASRLGRVLYRPGRAIATVAARIADFLGFGESLLVVARKRGA